MCSLVCLALQLVILQDYFSNDPVYIHECFFYFGAPIKQYYCFFTST